MGISIGIACVLSIGVVDFNRIWTSPIDTCHPTDGYSGINMIPCWRSSTSPIILSICIKPRLFAFQYTNLLSIDTYQNYDMSKPYHAIGCLLFNMRICFPSIPIKTMRCRSHIMPQAVSFSIYEFVVDRYLSKLWYVEAISCHKLFAFQYIIQISLSIDFVVDRYLYCSDR